METGQVSRLRFFRSVLTDVVLLPVVLFCVLNVSLVTYGIRMGQGQLNIVWNARPFEEVYADPAVSDSVKTKLRLIDEIRRFAYDSIGLKPSDNYTTFFDQKDQRLMYVVTGAERYQLKAYTWTFPVVGEVPYKGFFDEKKAKEEYYRLRALGYDANIGGAAGWSTLGWFRDPVLSSMLNYNEANLAELIIHELTHGTLFVKDSVDYNENLAQFVGVEGAKWFLRVKYGTDSQELQAYLTAMKEDEQKTAFMLEQAKFLGSVYVSLDAALAENEKAKIKQRAMLQIWQRAAQFDLQSDPSFAERLLGRMPKAGNTMFLQYTRYEGKRDDFSVEFSRCANDLQLFVRNMVVRYGAGR